MYRLAAPDPSLSAFIEHYWSVSPEPGREVELVVEVYVDARADLIFNFGAPYRRTRLGQAPVDYAHSNLDAQRTYPITIEQKGQVEVTGVRFHPGGLAPFVAGSVARWTGATVALGESFGSEGLQLEHSLRASHQFEQRKRLLDEFFSRRLDLSPSYQTFAAMLASLRENPLLSLKTLAERFDLAPRTLTRSFQRHLGLAPSTYGRVLRFQQALLRLMDGPPGTLGQLAADCGYYDQAHFVKEFKPFSGGIPGRFRSYFPAQAPDDFAPNLVAYLQDDQRPPG